MFNGDDGVLSVLGNCPLLLRKASFYVIYEIIYELTFTLIRFYCICIMILSCEDQYPFMCSHI